MVGLGNVSHTGRGNSHQMKRIPFIVLALHSILVALVAVVVATEGGESVMLWAPFMVLDFPVALFLPEQFARESLGGDVTYTVVFGLFLGIFGGLQYYLVSLLIVTWFSKRRSKGK